MNVWRSLKPMQRHRDVRKITTASRVDVNQIIAKRTRYGAVGVLVPARDVLLKFSPRGRIGMSPGDTSRALHVRVGASFGCAGWSASLPCTASRGARAGNTS